MLATGAGRRPLEPREQAVTDVCATDAVTLAGMLRRREISAREVTTAHVQRIEDVDGAVNAVVTRTFVAALDRAAAGTTRPRASHSAQDAPPGARPVQLRMFYIPDGPAAGEPAAAEPAAGEPAGEESRPAR
jgi:hypothetical protein